MDTTPISASYRSKAPKFVRWAILIGIVVVLNIFLQVGRSLILPEPQFNTYCPVSNAPAPQTATGCSAVGGAWTSSPDISVKGPTPVGATLPSGYCDVTAKCQTTYQDAEHQYALYAFIFGIGFGVLAIIVGVLPIGSSIVSAGLTYGGVLAFVIAAGQYWTDAGNILRFGISFIALAALIYIGLRRFRD